MSYAVFRIEGIKTTNDLRGIGKHNKDRVSKTNEDIDKERSADNIELISLNGKTYNERFDEIIKPYREEHEERMKTVRKDRVKSFSRHINDSRSDVATEFLFTSDTEFFKDKSKKDIERWAKESLKFVTEEIGIKENIIHAVVHMDEKTPHLHVVGVPLIKAYDGRRKKDVWQISRRKFIPGKEDLIKLQDKYHERMVQAGFNLKRGERGSEQKHETPQRYKARKLEEEITSKQEEKEKLEKTINLVESKFKNLSNAVTHYAQIDKIKAEEGILRRNKVSLDKGDYERLKNTAKASAYVKTQNNALQKENKKLKEENERLKKDNTAYKIENGHLKRKVNVLERLVKNIKQQLKPEFNKIGMLIGYLKAEASKKLRLKKEEVMDHQDKAEVQGAKLFEVHLKEIQKENELEL